MGRASAVLGAAVALVAVVAVMVVVVLLGDAGGAECDSSRVTRQISGSALDTEQLNDVQVILEVVDQRRLPVKAAVVAVAVGLVESNLRNLDHGDLDSVGVFQQRPSQGWGTQAQIMDPVYATGRFLDALVALPGWESMPVGDAAQAVQRSAFPGRYAEREAQAQQIVVGVRGAAGTLPPPCIPSHQGDPAGAVQRALSQLGKPYCWAGGDANGPTRGDGSSPPPCGPQSPGYDCSGLMVYAFAPYVALPRVARAQYQVPGATRVPVGLAQPGDLLFWADNIGDPESIHHVALVVSPGQLVEAPQDGETVHVRPYSQNEAGLMPVAIRVGS